MEQKRIPTTEILATALMEAGAPADMVKRAKDGYYDDYKSPIAAPISQLYIDASRAGLRDIAKRAKDGDFDAQKWESDEWAQSPEGQEVFRSWNEGK